MHIFRTSSLGKRILYHAAFWATIYSVFILSAYLQSHDLKGVILFNLAMLPLDMTGAYITIYLLIPRLLFPKRYVAFAIAFFLFSAAFIVLVVTPYTYVLLQWTGEAGRWANLTDFAGYSLLYNTIIFLMINGLASAVKISKHWLKLQAQKQELEKAQLQLQVRLKEAELSLLKLQLHPHFLFNTLNNLYGLTLQKSDKAPDIVMKLSEMLHYMLYDCAESTVPLVREIRFLQNYLDLEKIRHEAGTRIRFVVEGDPQGHQIVPLIMLTFVENAVKHGLAGKPMDPWIEVLLTIRGSHLAFSVSNSIMAVPSHGIREEKLPRGIGLANVQKRLQMQYPNRHTLALTPQRDSYTAHLTLNLSTNSL